MQMGLILHRVTFLFLLMHEVSMYRLVWKEKSLGMRAKFHFNTLGTTTGGISSDGTKNIDERENNPKRSRMLPKFPKILQGNKFSKENLAKLGLAFSLSYGCVSNFNAITAVIIAWCIHGKTYGLSPLCAGQWSKFLAIYAGIWVANNFIRPLRVSLAVFISPFLEKLVEKIKLAANVKPSVAVFLTVILVNVFGTISYLVAGLFFATRILRVPLLP